MIQHTSFIMPLQIGKTPVVVPRQKEFDEHINNHQLVFCQEMARRQKNIILVKELEDLKNIIINFNIIIATMEAKHNSNNTLFCNEFEKLIEKLFHA